MQPSATLPAIHWQNENGAMLCEGKPTVCFTFSNTRWDRSWVFGNIFTRKGYSAQHRTVSTKPVRHRPTRKWWLARKKLRYRFERRLARQAKIMEHRSAEVLSKHSETKFQGQIRWTGGEIFFPPFDTATRTVSHIVREPNSAVSHIVLQPESTNIP